MNAGIAYGRFSADDTSNYEANEVDAVIEYSFSEKFSLTAAYASVTFTQNGAVDYDQFRVITNYNF